jgi:hypothetical protein
VLARNSKIEHPLGVVVDLPRLVPAFSSKGFPFLANPKPQKRAKHKSKGHTKTGAKPAAMFSETTLAMETVGGFIKDSILVSAYDLHHGHFNKPERFFVDKELVFLDSGGYELSPGFDQTEPVHWGTQKKPFSFDDYVKVLTKLPRNLPFVISNYDWKARKKPLQDQIILAQKLFTRFPYFLNNFIVKPVGNRRFVDVDEIVHHAKKCFAFNVLGITEKELGCDLMERLKSLARLRLGLDRADVKVPIHVWGGLDPVLTPLYFLAGGEIFDGISWLRRYAYIDGVAAYRDSYNVLEEGIETSQAHSRALALHHNLKILRGMATAFRGFVLAKGTAFNMFGSRAEALEKAYRALVTQIPAIEGGQ